MTTTSTTPPTTPAALFEWLQIPGAHVVRAWTGPDAWATFCFDVGTAPTGFTLQRVDPRRPYGPENVSWRRPSGATK